MTRNNTLYRIGGQFTATRAIFAGGFLNQTVNQVNYLALFDPSGNNLSTTESVIDVPITFDYRVTRVRIAVQVNSKDGNTVISFRDDGTDIGKQTVAAAFTGEKDSGALNVLVAGSSKVNFKIDTSASTAGSLSCYVIVEYET